MRFEKYEVYSLHIPFRLDFTHSQARRLASDSFVIKLTAEGSTGYGEALVRDYVSGKMTDGDLLDHIAHVVGEVLESLSDLSVAGLRSWSEALTVEHKDLPVLCAVEIALLDLLCKMSNTDVYDLLALQPLRTSITYGGTVPMLPLAAAKQLLELSRKLQLANLRLKLGADLDYNRDLVRLTRSVVGDDVDLRIDANAGWNLESIFENLPLLADAGISVVEEPFGRDPAAIRQCRNDARSDGFSFVADDSVLSLADLKTIAADRTFSMINIRLSKNGGLFRSLELAKEAEALGVQYQLGCLVGETGILSAAGRVAASLMADTVYVDGSYDAILLSDNVTDSNMTFGGGGRADIIRGNGLGFRVAESKLEELHNDYRSWV